MAKCTTYRGKTWLINWQVASSMQDLLSRCDLAEGVGEDMAAAWLTHKPTGLSDLVAPFVSNMFIYRYHYCVETLIYEIIMTLLFLYYISILINNALLIL